MTEFLSEMNVILDKYDAMTVGECPHTPDPTRVIKYVSAKEKQLNMVFQFVRHSSLPNYTETPTSISSPTLPYQHFPDQTTLRTTTLIIPFR
jgi:hypothetical protein